MAEMVKKSSTEEIINHWIMAVSCILLIISGYAFLFQLKAVSALFGGFNAMKVVHNWLGVVFTASLMYSMTHYLRDALSYDADDMQWIKVGGGYLSHKTKVPPMGKYNPGQKAYYLAILAAGFAIAASGFAIWLIQGSKALTTVSHLVHNLAFSLYIVAVPVHIYLGSLANPGTFRIMVYGTVPVEFAKKKYPKWMKEIGKL